MRLVLRFFQSSQLFSEASYPSHWIRNLSSARGGRLKPLGMWSRTASMYNSPMSAAGTPFGSVTAGS